MLSGLMSKFYLIVGGVMLFTYVSMELRGTIFSDTDRRPSAYASRSSGGGRSGGGGGGIFFWGSGYRGGK